MEKIIFATGNQDKMKEIRAILGGLNMEILSMKEAGIDVEVIEDGKTFMENAIIKAKAIAAVKEAENTVVLADDSGLEVDYLNKEPGIYSARYMGEDTSYKVKNQNIIDRLEGVPKEERTARFVCAIAAVLPNKEVICTEGIIEGYIGWKESGSNGFGYDPIFYIDEYNCSTAELPVEVKNELSHRGKALCAMKERLGER